MCYTYNGCNVIFAYRFAKSEGDGAIVRDITASELAMKKYKVMVHTGDVKGAGTDANVFITIHGHSVCISAY